MLFDFGSSSYPTSLAWFVEHYGALGVSFDEIWAWEAVPVVHDNYWTEVPARIKSRLRFFNTKVWAGCRQHLGRGQRFSWAAWPWLGLAWLTRAGIARRATTHASGCSLPSWNRHQPTSLPASLVPVALQIDADKPPPTIPSLSSRSTSALETCWYLPRFSAAARCIYFPHMAHFRPPLPTPLHPNDDAELALACLPAFHPCCCHPQIVKLDIDTSSVELPFMAAVERDADLRSRIAEMHFEMHYNHP